MTTALHPSAALAISSQRSRQVGEELDDRSGFDSGALGPVIWKGERLRIAL
jgi:hypothetical protein